MKKLIKTALSTVLALVMALSMGIVAAAEEYDSFTMQYDDRMDISGKTVEIIDAGKPTSYKVGYGVEENAVLDDAVIAIDGDKLIATGIGTAKVRIDGVLYEVTVEKAKINIISIVGQSNSGNHFANATSDITCSAGTAYYWGYGAIEPKDYTEPSMGFHAPLLAELYAQSAAAGNPVKNVLVWEEGYTSKNGKSITAWAVEKEDAINTDGTDGAAQMIRDCIAYYELNSDKYEIVDKIVFCNHGTTDYYMNPERYINLFIAMWERLKAEGMQYLAFLRVRGSHSLATTENVDIFYNAPVSAQFEMVRNREDMFMVSIITENWTGNASTKHSVDIRNYITFMEEYGKDGSYNDSYGNAATVENGVLTTSMKALYGSNNKVHYGKFGYGIIGADAAYNMYASLYGNKVHITKTDSS
ncbi:MAG: hypothetical protein IJA06_01310 [Oscillospiraceae bacterium]|nr:hypothetical protein [Oscillospiraceae bacterium]